MEPLVVSTMSAYGARWYRRLVAAVRRDGPACWLCGSAGADTLDHVVPVARGGLTVAENLRPAHRTCNSSRGARPARARRVPLVHSREW